MFKFDAEAFYKATTELQHMRTALVTSGFKSTEHHSDGSITISAIDDPVTLKLTLERADLLRPQIDILGAKLALLSLDRMRDALKNRSATWEGLIVDITEIDGRLRDELSSAYVYALEPRETEYFEPRRPLFGPVFASRFTKDGIFELDEAAKCMALGRPTAAVFHLMRLMEIGICAIARCLQIPDPLKPAERNWGHILGVVRTGIEVRWTKTSDRLHGDGQLFEALYASLDAVKNPWRNSTMHVENKYTDDEAEHIFVAVKGFMKKLADRMDEDGCPKA